LDALFRKNACGVGDHDPVIPIARIAVFLSLGSVRREMGSDFVLAGCRNPDRDKS
jgi:hypothetical protein